MGFGRFSYPSVPPMNEVTRILSAAEQGDPHTAERLLPLIYDELRKLAAYKLAQEQPGQTLQPTALVHEAYLRLVETDKAQRWDCRGHFFAAAAEAMRRILVDNARRKQAEKHGGGRQRHDLLEAELAIDSTGEELFTVDAALSRLATREPTIARLVEFRFFAGLTLEEAAAHLGLSHRTAYRHWAYARAWLRRELDRSGERNTVE
jgi:RNA polymerase sigma factor (TIGR02999 family)